jgi:hypothetical protein
MSASLENQFISDRYTSLLHLSANSLTGDLEYVYDGLGNQAPIQVSTDKVVINNVEQPVATTLTTLYDIVFPINSIYLTAENINPSTTFSGTAWQLVSEGRYLAGVGTGSDKNGDQATINKGSNSDLVGEYDHHLTLDELPEHNHNTFKDGSSDLNTTQNFAARKDASGGSQNYAIQSTTETPDVFPTSNIGSSDPHHNNMPPYFGVYVWKRTS